MTLNLSTVAFLGAAVLAAAVALGFAPVKPWLFVGAGLGVVGFMTQPTPPTPGV
jgi:hypothetical protein